MNKTFFCIFPTFLLFTAAAGLCDTQYKRVPLRGSTTYVTIGGSSGVPQKIVFWAPTKGNMTSQLKLEGNFPQGTKIKAQAVYVKKDYDSALSDTKGRYALSLNTLKEQYNQHSLCLDISVEEDKEELPGPEDFPPLNSPLCDLISAEDLQEIASTLGDVFGGTWSTGNACAYFVAQIDDLSGPDEDYLCGNFDHDDLLQLGVFCPIDGLFAVSSPRAALANEYKQYYALLRKDSCLKPAKSEYLVMVTADFSAVPNEALLEPISISFRAKEYKLQSGKEAAIKPKSEGRYAPSPLIMMNWLGTTCGNVVDVVKWKNFKPSKITKLNVYALLSYKEMILNLTVASAALKGGKGTAELITRDESYGVCFSLVKKRQNKNGYPG